MAPSLAVSANLSRGPIGGKARRTGLSPSRGTRRGAVSRGGIAVLRTSRIRCSITEVVSARPLSEPSGVEAQLPSAGGVNDESCHVQRTALRHGVARARRGEFRRSAGAVAVITGKVTGRQG